MGWYVGSAYWTSVSQYVGAEAAEVFIRVEGNDFCAGFQNFIASVINNPIQDYWYCHGDYHIFSHLLHMYYMIRCLQPMKTVLSYILSKLLDKETNRSWLTMINQVLDNNNNNHIADNLHTYCSNLKSLQLILNNCLIYFSSRRILWWQKKL